MADISIQSIGNVDPRVQIRSGPVYLIELNRDFTDVPFIAIKLDEFPNSIKVVGFYYKGDVKKAYSNLIKSKIISEFSELVKKAQTETPEEIIEIMFPWRVISSIQSLSYKHKGIK